MQKDISFLELISNYSICIPKIQRDYAQGRTDSKSTEIRNKFLDDILDTLESENTEPLVLDFVYGSVSGSGSTNSTGCNAIVFTPLDGQQRLTTLFLLHWYLSNELQFFKNQFTYETRISSKDFCNELVNHSLSEIKANIAKIEKKKPENLAEGIKNEPWFFWAWRKDPTITGMLTMLNSIDEKLQDVADLSHLWKSLTDNKKIVFHLLPLEKFNLTDELYVKMNARGKELSSFDILKSSLEEQMKKNGVNTAIQNEWRKNVDNKWMDLFWNTKAVPFLKNEENVEQKKEEVVEKIETYYYRFLQRMMNFQLFLIDDFENPKGLNSNQFEEGIKSVQQYVQTKDNIIEIFSQLCKCKFYNESFFFFVEETMKNIMYEENSKVKCISDLISIDFWNIDNRTVKEPFDQFINEEITYLGRILFYAMIQFVKYNPAKNIAEDEHLKEEFNNWMRIVRNLAYNTNYYNVDDYKGTLNSLAILAENVYKSDFRNIHVYLDKDGKVSRFSREQVSEEIEKARQIINNGKIWEEKIIEAENYAFFRGTIRFLFTEKDGQTVNWSLFEDRFKRATEYFDTSGVKEIYRQNARLICTLISLFTNWNHCCGHGRIQIGNGIQVWSYIIKNNYLLQPLVDLLDLDEIPLETTCNSSNIEEFEGWRIEDKLSHHELAYIDMCNNKLIDKAINTMGEGIVLNYHHRYHKQFALYRPNANADWRKFVIGNKRNRLLAELTEESGININQKLGEIPYFWGWDIAFTWKDTNFVWRSWENKLICGETLKGTDDINDVEELRVVLDELIPENKNSENKLNIES